MKTKFFFSVLASAAALLVASSCSRDAAINEGGPAGEQSGVSLRIQTPKVAYLTRAGIASDAENVVSEILLYAFDEDGNMVGTSNLVEGTDYTATEDAGVTTIEFEDAWLSQVAGKEIVFYAVANQDTGDGTTVTDLEAGTPPVTKTPFEALVSDALTNTDGWVDTSINLELLMTAQSEPIEIVGDATGEMSLKRRIARFDIVNPMAATGDGQVVITNIQAFNGPTQGNIFAAGPNFTPDRANYDLINSGAGQGGAFDSGNPAWSGTVTDGKNGAYVSEVNAKGEDTWRLPSAFYMFPTMLATAPGADNMNLYIEATQNGVEQIYVPSNDVEIKANHRYTLTLHPPTLTFTIDVANFDDGEVTATEPGRETEEITLSATAADGKGGDEITNYEGNWAVYYATSLGDEILTFEVATQFGSDVVFEPTFDGFPVPVWANSSIFTKTTTLTYDAVKGRQTIDKYVATIPAGATDTDNPFTVKFKQTYGDDVKKAYFVSDKDAADILNSCIFDMLNNAAAYNAASLGVDAKFFPLIMENILSLTQNNSTGIVIDDISDLKYFPNLKYFATTAPGFTTDVTSIDLSFLPNLLTATLNNAPNVTSVRVASDNPVVGSSLNLSGMPLLETLDVSRWTYLERIVVDATCPLLKTLDLRNMRYYKDFTGINNSAIENILLEGEYTNITNTFKFEGLSSLTTLDFSKMETEALVLFLQDISLESIKFPDTPGIFSLNMAMQITNSIVPKLDLTNVLFTGNTSMVTISGSVINEFAFDPMNVKSASIGVNTDCVIYIPDAIYDTLDAAGSLDFNGIKSHCSMTTFASTGIGNITFAKYSTYVP